MIRETAAGVEIDVRLIPRSKKTQLGGEREGALVVRVAAPPVDDRANQALVAFLSEILHTPKQSIRIVGGEHTRKKRVMIAGLTAQAVRALISVSA